MLKWLLEGEWVADAQGHKYDGGLSLDDTLDLLNDPVFPPQGRKTLKSSQRRDLETGQWVSILKAAAPPRSSHVPLLEATEWGCLEDYAFNAAQSRIRIKGAGIGDKPVQDPLFIKKVQKAAKAGIRAVFGRMLGREEGSDLLLQVTREQYNGGRGCFTQVADPDQVGSLRDFDYKPCESFEEYVASQALLSAQRDLKLLGDGLQEQERNALFAYEMYRRKADVGRQITDEMSANDFLLRLMEFIYELRNDDALNRQHQTNLGYYTDGPKRAANLQTCSAERLAEVSPGGEEFRLQIPVRLYNNGFTGLAGAELALYHDGQLQKSIFADLPPGESRFIAKAAEQKPKPKDPKKRPRTEYEFEDAA